jgi:hypothetical protein
MDDTKHILHTSCGVVVTMTVNDAGAFRCVWEPAPPYSRKKFKRIAREYRPWRNRILSEWAKRTGQRVLVVEM